MKMVEDIKTMKTKLFSHEAINSDNPAEILSEVIYSAYKPVDMGISDVEEL